MFYRGAGMATIRACSPASAHTNTAAHRRSQSKAPTSYTVHRDDVCGHLCRAPRTPWSTVCSSSRRVRQCLVTLRMCILAVGHTGFEAYARSLLTCCCTPCAAAGASSIAVHQCSPRAGSAASRGAAAVLSPPPLLRLFPLTPFPIRPSL